MTAYVPSIVLKTVVQPSLSQGDRTFANPKPVSIAQTFERYRSEIAKTAIFGASAAISSMSAAMEMSAMHAQAEPAGGFSPPFWSILHTLVHAIVRRV